MKSIFLFLSLIFLAGCMTPQFTPPIPGELPIPMPDRNIEENTYYGRLVRSYGNGITHERVKILYLLDATEHSPFEFYRNGWTYDGKATAKHLRKKYRQRIKKIRTARDFIEHVASISSKSGRPYLSLPGDGKSYRSGDLLIYELNRLEAFLDKKYGHSVHPIKQKVQEAAKAI